MSIKNEVDIIRKENLKLNKKDTKLVFETLMKVYKSKIVNEARNIMGYTLDVVVANMNGFNRLGNSQNIYQKWGDNFYIDFYNSVFCKEEVDENGDLVSNKSEAFSEINELDSIKNISFSLKEIIDILHDFFKNSTSKSIYEIFLKIYNENKKYNQKRLAIK